jgi:cytochrome oxidase Cu insertion factor (SCO1/SenC/PrrC family)
MLFPIRLATFAVLVVALPLPTSRAQTRGQPAPEERSGLAVSAKAPKFTLKDQDGRERSLDEFLAKGKVALVFYRSADW